MQTALIDGLNEQQREIVLAPDSNMLVIAGAGTGKTRVLVSRIAYLVQAENVAPYKILAVTFTNKAAAEMRDRICSCFEWEDPHNMWISTFHGMCFRLLKRYHLQANLPENFSVFSPNEQASIIRNFYSEYGLKPRDKTYGSFKTFKIDADSVVDRINQDKDQNIAPTISEEDLTKILQSLKDKWRSYDSDTIYTIAYAYYLRVCAQSGGVDFSDLLTRTKTLLESSSEVRQELHERFSHIFVDEFQDTNTVQYELLKLMKGEHCHIFVVGDDDQAIYGWRGANYRNLMSLQHDIPDIKLYELSINYRSNQNILTIANALIGFNSERMIHKELVSHSVYASLIDHQRDCLLQRNLINGQELQSLNDVEVARRWKELVDSRQLSPQDVSSLEQMKRQVVEDERPFILQLERADLAEGLAVHTLVQHWHQVLKVPYEEIAVLYRNNFLSSNIESNLHAAGIPYQVYGGFRFYDREEITTALSYLRLMINPKDDVAFARAIGTPKRSIGKSSIAKLGEYAAECGLSMYEVLDNIIQTNNFTAQRAFRKFLPFYDLIELLKREINKRELGSLLHYVYQQTGLLEFYQQQDAKENTKEGSGRSENLMQLMRNAHNFTKVAALQGQDGNLLYNAGAADELSHLSHTEIFTRFVANAVLSSGTETDSNGEFMADSQPQGVQLMTIHASKGLEFTAVIVVGCESGIMPSMRTDNEEEERRLAYVAFTRAKKYLYILFAASRMSYDGSWTKAGASSFLHEAVATTNQLPPSQRPYRVGRFDGSRYGF